MNKLLKIRGFVALPIIIGSAVLAVGILGGLAYEYKNNQAVLSSVNKNNLLAQVSGVITPITKETLLSMLDNALSDNIVNDLERNSLLSALDSYLLMSNVINVPSIVVGEKFSHTSSSIGDVGTVLLPKKQLPFLNIKLFSTAKAADVETSRILAYVKEGQGGIDQVFYYNLATSENVQVTNESVSVKNVFRVVDYPASGIIYTTASGAKFIRLADSSVVPMPDFKADIYDYSAISSDGKLAYFDGSNNLIIRDLLSSNLDIIKNFPTPLKNSSKGAVYSPLVFSADGSQVYLNKPFLVNGRGADAIVSLDINDGSIKELVADNAQKRPPLIIGNKLYYKDYDMFNLVVGKPVGLGNLNAVDLVSGNNEVIAQGVDITVFKGSSNNMIIFEGDSSRTADPSDSSGNRQISHINYRYYNLITRQYGQLINFDKTGVVEFVGFGNSEKELIFSDYLGPESEQVVGGIASIPYVIFSYNIDSGIFKDLFTNIRKVNQADRG